MCSTSIGCKQSRCSAITWTHNLLWKIATPPTRVDSTALSLVAFQGAALQECGGSAKGKSNIGPYISLSGMSVGAELVEVQPDCHHFWCDFMKQQSSEQQKPVTVHTLAPQKTYKRSARTLQIRENISSSGWGSMPVAFIAAAFGAACGKVSPELCILLLCHDKQAVR